VTEKLNIKPEECVFIDDHEENLVPARQLGMHTILFQSITQMKRDLEKLL
jgi:HAD superfamily hydrolase (TIGR01509 family)